MANEPSEREILWRDYALSTDLYKFYFELLVKINVVYYAITGGIVSFCLSKFETANYVRWGLLLPTLMAAGLAIFFIYAAPFATTLRDKAYDLAKKLEIAVPRDFSPLVFALRIFAVLHMIGALGLVVLMYAL